MLGLPLLSLGLCALAAFVAAFVRGLAGFGMAILLVPLIGLVISPGEAVVVSNMLGLLIGLVGARKVWNAGETSAGVIGGTAMLLTPVGLLVLFATPPGLARVLIAGVAIAAFLLVLLPARPGHAPGTVETGLTGAAAGLLTGFAGMPGPPVVPYYLRRPIPREVARASMLTVFLLTSIASTVAALALGLASWRDALFALLLFGPVLAGNHLGSMAFGKVSDAAWRGFVGFLLAMSALMAVVRLITPN
ncbi:sulfite exporter TauE/SafE family protein [Novosphingobium sp. 17-62-19]|uniref:sulfite exporter TauE/SafE family protein n=1 Tax=Novosphingobium sp. 17-62-19 TaxID=1970406 RepID=UPI0025DB82C3|nr:sulfite exporter TauE/SafE family protein [Novosphingobium sp. 17-62-19]